MTVDNHPVIAYNTGVTKGELMTDQERMDEETRFIELAYDLMMEGEMDEDAIYDEVHRIMDKEAAR